MIDINFKHEVQDWIVIFRFNWEFNNENTDSVFTKVKNIIAKEQISNLIFNLQWVEIINSRWAWWIAWIYESIDSFWGKLYMTNMNEYIEDALDLLWLFLFVWRAKNEKEATSLITKK